MAKSTLKGYPYEISDLERQRHLKRKPESWVGERHFGPFSILSWYKVARKKPNRFSPINWYKLFVVELKNYHRLWRPLIVAKRWETPTFFFRFTKSRWLSPRKFRLVFILPVLYFWWCVLRGFPKSAPAPTLKANLWMFVDYLDKNYQSVFLQWAGDLFSLMHQWTPTFGVVFGFGRFHTYVHSIYFLWILFFFLLFSGVSYEWLQRRNIAAQWHFWDAVQDEVENKFPLYWFLPAWEHIQVWVRWKIAIKVANNETEIFEEFYWDEDKVARNTYYGQYGPPIFYILFYLLWFPFRLLLLFPLLLISFPILFFWWLDHLYAKTYKSLFTPLALLRRIHRDVFWLLSIPLDALFGYVYPYYRDRKDVALPFIKALPNRMEMDWTVVFLEDEEEQLYSEMEAVPEESRGGWFYRWRWNFYFYWRTIPRYWRWSRPLLPRPVLGLTYFRYLNFILYRTFRPLIRRYREFSFAFGRFSRWLVWNGSLLFVRLSELFSSLQDRLLQNSSKTPVLSKVFFCFNKVVDFLIETSVKYPLSPISLFVRSRVFVPWLFESKNFIRFLRFLYQKLLNRYDRFAANAGWRLSTQFSRPLYLKAIKVVDFWYKMVRPLLGIFIYWSSWLLVPVFLIFLFETPFPFLICQSFNLKLPYNQALMLSAFFPILLFVFPPLRRWAWWDFRLLFFLPVLTHAIFFELAFDMVLGLRRYVKHRWLFWHAPEVLLSHFFWVDFPFFILLLLAPFIQFGQLILTTFLSPSIFEWVVPFLYSLSGMWDVVIYQFSQLYEPSPFIRFFFRPLYIVLTYVPFFERLFYILELWYYYELCPYFSIAIAPQYEWLKHTITRSIPLSLFAVDFIITWLQLKSLFIPEWIQVACTLENYPVLVHNKPYQPPVPIPPSVFAHLQWRSPPPFVIPPQVFPLPPWRLNPTNNDISMTRNPFFPRSLYKELHVSSKKKRAAARELERQIRRYKPLFSLAHFFFAPTTVVYFIAGWAKYVGSGALYAYSCLPDNTYYVVSNVIYSFHFLWGIHKWGKYKCRIQFDHFPIEFSDLKVTFGIPALAAFNSSGLSSPPIDLRFSPPAVFPAPARPPSTEEEMEEFWNFSLREFNAWCEGGPFPSEAIPVQEFTSSAQGSATQFDPSATPATQPGLDQATANQLMTDLAAYGDRLVASAQAKNPSFRVGTFTSPGETVGHVELVIQNINCGSVPVTTGMRPFIEPTTTPIFRDISEIQFNLFEIHITGNVHLHFWDCFSFWSNWRLVPGSEPEQCHFDLYELYAAFLHLTPIYGPPVPEGEEITDPIKLWEQSLTSWEIAKAFLQGAKLLVKSTIS